jgi:hypothetical protein
MLVLYLTYTMKHGNTKVKFKLMFLSEWREFPVAPCHVGKKKLDNSSRLDVEIERP